MTQRNFSSGKIATASAVRSAVPRQRFAALLVRIFSGGKILSISRPPAPASGKPRFQTARFGTPWKWRLIKAQCVRAAHCSVVRLVWLSFLIKFQSTELSAPVLRHSFSGFWFFFYKGPGIFFLLFTQRFEFSSAEKKPCSSSLKNLPHEQIVELFFSLSTTLHTFWWARICFTRSGAVAVDSGNIIVWRGPQHGVGTKPSGRSQASNKREKIVPKDAGKNFLFEYANELNYYRWWMESKRRKNKKKQR